MRTRWTRAMAAGLAVLASAVLMAVPPPAHALGPCDWRRPDQDINRLFPGADDYHPIYKRTQARRDDIETRLGYRLAGWEDLIRYYLIMKEDRRIGTVYVHLTPDGTELVVAFNNDGTVKGVLLQRYLGSKKSVLESRQFLGQFVGKTVTAPLELGKDVKPACPELESASAAIALTVRKLLVFYSIYG